MRGPAFPTAIPHDDSKALPAEARRRFNAQFRWRRDRQSQDDTHTSPVGDIHTEDEVA